MTAEEKRALVAAKTKSKVAAKTKTTAQRPMSVQDIVTRAYRDILYRDPDPGGLETYINYLQSGGSEADLRQILASSTEGTTQAPYRKVIRDWYSMKPSTPATFRWTPEQEAAAKRTVGEETRPFYQEQATESGEEYRRALQNARAGFSRRGLWGAATTTPTAQVDPTTGLALTAPVATGVTGGPQSGLRQVGEQRLSEFQGRQSTAFGRAYTEAVAGLTQGRRAEAEDIYQKTIRQPYSDQYQQWLAQLQGLQAGLR